MEYNLILLNNSGAMTWWVMFKKRSAGPFFQGTIFTAETYRAILTRYESPRFQE